MTSSTKPTAEELLAQPRPPELRSYSKAQATLVKPAEKLRLNLGCGEDRRAGWMNVDSRIGSRADRLLDLNRALPWHTGAASEIYACHVLEHLVFWDQFLDECYRVLKPGTGLLTIRVPDFEKALELYLVGGTCESYVIRKTGNEVPIDWRGIIFGNVEDQLEGCGHVMGFSWGTGRPNDLGDILEEKGFLSIERRPGLSFEIWVEARR